MLFWIVGFSSNYCSSDGTYKRLKYQCQGDYSCKILGFKTGKSTAGAFSYMVTLNTCWLLSGHSVSLTWLNWLSKLKKLFSESELLLLSC